MRKYGKYEKMPDGTRAKQPPMKSILLQTYFTSLVCLILCVSMFFGTSYAWFTAEVDNAGNEIYIGTLDVELEKKVDNTEKPWVSLSEKDGNDANKTLLFDKNIRWEPGYTTVETVRVVNKGDLAFNYGLTFVADFEGTTEEEAAQLRKVAQYFEVYVHVGDYDQDETKPTSFAQLKESDKWNAVRLGDEVATLADILEKGLPVFSGTITDVVKTYGPTDPVPTGPSKEDSNPAEAVYIIALHMKEDAGSKLPNEAGKENELTAQELMGKKLSLNVKLVAHQHTYEQDAFGEYYYDSFESFVENLTEIKAVDQKDITYADLTAGKENVGPVKLDAVYEFKPLLEQLTKCAYQFQNFEADFVVYADKKIAANDLLLAGQLRNEWIGMTIDAEVEAGTPLRLMQRINSNLHVSFDALCELAGSKESFQCGLMYKGTENVTFTVELRLYKVDVKGNPTGDFVVVSTQQVTVPAAQG